MSNFKKFSLFYLLFLTLFIIIIILFNWIINPYNIYKSIPINKLSQKPMVTSHIRLAKAMAVNWKKPEGLILGSSTAETGLNPEHLAWNNRNIYNLGLSGANIYEVMRYLQHSESVKPIQKVVLVVNFFMFNAYLSNRDDFNESLLNVDIHEQRNPLAINNFFSTLLSYDAIKASIETINNQNKKNAFQKNGQLVLNYREAQIQQLKGYKNNFLYTESYNKTSLLPLPKEKYTLVNQENQINTIYYMKKIIEICEKNNTDLIIVIAPEHVRLLETYKQLKLWEIYEAWQKRLVKIVSAHNKKYPDSKFSLWSFNKVNAFTTEKLPEKNDTTSKMQWFWDPYHFKNEMGNLILSKILETPRPENISDFSVRLSKNNIRKELQINQLNLSEWEKTHADEVGEIRENLRHSKNN